MVGEMERGAALLLLVFSFFLGGRGGEREIVWKTKGGGGCGKEDGT